ncbi:hypothetical protein BCON_0019g00490 [Botryotinia convoluta]|uniref:Uncharacterized protein n=1 Tax=Botryotinia convoluta TaxID=54673 RepID=A0A4Z1J035_9HELO|nr:hypothetical protein BCON_0019g00490 [Botryotinia convoluta]
MTPSRRFRLLLSQMPREAFGDSEHEIQAFESSLQGIAFKIENVDNALNNTAQDLRQRHISSTDAANNHESTEQVAASIVTKKEGVRGDATGDVIEEIAIEVFHEDLVQKGTADEEVAKETDFEDVVSDEVTEQNNIGEGVIAKNAPGILMNNSNGGAIDEEVVKVESEDDILFSGQISSYDALNDNLAVAAVITASSTALKVIKDNVY